MRRRIIFQNGLHLAGWCTVLVLSACGSAQTGSAGFGSDAGTATPLRVAAAAMAAGRPETVVQLLDDYLQHNPGDTKALLQRGQAFAALGQPADAAQDFTHVIAANPRSLEALSGLARARAAQSHAAEAEATWRKVLALQPDDVGAQTGLAIALDLQEKHSDAQTIYTTLLAHNPDDMVARANLGLSLALSGRFDDALPLLKAVVPPGSAGQRSATGARLRHNLAVGLLLAGHETEARDILGQDLSPSEVDAAMAGLRQFASVR